MGARVSTERDDHGSGTASKQSAVHDEVVEVRKEGEATEELSVHFGYQCQQNGASGKRGRLLLLPVDTIFEVGSVEENTNTFSVTLPPNGFRTSSFSSLSGAALGANATLANSSICNGKLGEEILPGLDSPKTFRKLDSLSRTSSLKSELSSLKVRNHVGSQSLGDLASYESTSFLHAGDVQMAGGAAGEDRVQAVCSEDQGWLFCGIYDGFNGRDAADFLAGTLYENIGLHLRLLEHQDTNSMDTGVLDGLREALWQTESDFLEKVEQEMQERPDLVMVGSCVLVVLMYGRNLYTLNLGDSRAVLATSNAPNAMMSHHPSLYAVALTERHVVEDSRERERIMKEHPEDPRAISNGRLKGKLRVTRAFGAGYLKKAVMNNALMGILRVKDLSSPPYLTTKPSVSRLEVQPGDKFVVIGSDGLFDFFTNEEVVEYVDKFLMAHPTGDPAKYMVEQLLVRAAHTAGIPVDQLKSIPIGRRRKFHDDVTIIVVDLRTEFSSSKASTFS